MNILQACENPELFQPWFRDRETWASWFAFLAALFGLPMTDEQFEIYKRHTGRQERPTEPTDEAWLIIGRRGGKSRAMALVATYLACFYDYQQYLSPGERGTIMVIAADRRQARSIMRYVTAMLTGIPLLKQMVVGELRPEGVDLNNAITIEVGTASFRSTRGYTYVACLADELAFWRTDDAAEPDYAVLDAVRPGMATIPNAMLICASSPYAKRGALYDAFRRYFGKDGMPLVWKAATREMNPTVSQSFVDRAYEKDASSASAEYGADFRNDIESFIAREAVEACVSVGVRERAPLSGLRYVAFVDPSGGSADSFTLAVGHEEKKVAILDAVREIKPPFSPEQTVADLCKLLKSYRITKVVGDRYAGEWPREQFRKHHITYEPAAAPKSDLYRDVLPKLNSGQVDLLDLPIIVNQFVGLERRVARSGKESIDHAPNAHDDVVNAIAGMVSQIRSGGYRLTAETIGDGSTSFMPDRYLPGFAGGM